MKCPKCNNEIPNNSKFCLHCGEIIPFIDKKNKTQKCADCGTLISKNTDKLLATCPCCGSTNLKYDEQEILKEKLPKKENFKLEQLNNMHFHKTVGNNISKKTKRILVLIGCLLLIFILIYSCNSNNSFGKLRWSELILSSHLPTPESNSIEIWNDNSDSLRVDIGNINAKEYYNYVNACKVDGYTWGSEEDANNYSAYNVDRYYLQLYYSSYSEELHIRLDAPLSVSDIDWNNHSISSLLITPPSTIGSILNENKEQIEILVVLSGDDEYESYRNDIISLGYTIESVIEDKTYSAFNDKGGKVELSYISGSKEMKVLYYYPIEFEEFIWPTVGIATFAPVPNSFSGKIINHYDWTFSAYINNISKNQYKYYVQKCIEKGFDKDISDYGDSFYADHWWYNNMDINVSYRGFNTMYIHISGDIDHDYSWHTRTMTAEEKAYCETLGSNDVNEEDESLITINVSKDELIGKECNNVKDMLVKFGFTNIELFTEKTQEESQSNKVYDINIEEDGRSKEIIKGEQYSKDSKIQIKLYEYEKQDENIILMEIDKYELLYKEYDYVKNELEKIGFTNINSYSETTKKEDKANQVYEITVRVDGKTSEIEKNQQYPRDAKVSIKYYKYEKPGNVSYSTNDEEMVKFGNQGIYSYIKKGTTNATGGRYDLYYIIDFDEGYVYYFGEGYGSEKNAWNHCDKIKITSGTLNDILIFTYKDGSEKWEEGLHFKWKNQPDHLIWQSYNGMEADYYTTDLDEALIKRDKKKIKNYY